jgi:hypothetical protein
LDAAIDLVHMAAVVDQVVHANCDEVILTEFRSEEVSRELFEL